MWLNTVQTIESWSMKVRLLNIMLHKVVLIFSSVDETLVCDHSNERGSYRGILVTRD